MIVPMKKISLVILDKDRKSSLKALRKLGVVHIEDVQGSSDELSSYKKQEQKVSVAYSILSEVKLDKSTKQKNVELLNYEQSIELAEKVIALSEEKKQCLSQINSDTTELERFTKWGSVNPADFEFLEKKGVYLYMYEIPSDKYDSISEELSTVLVNKDKSQSRILVLTDYSKPAGERPSGLCPEAYEVVMPRMATEELANVIKANFDRIKSIEAELKDCAKYLTSLNNLLSVISKEVEFENLFSGMGLEECDSTVKLSWLTGYVPTEDLSPVVELAKAQAWGIAVSDPTDEDNVPTKLKNNKLVSLIYPVTDFLGTVPGYNEYDISNWFLSYFTVFFGMIFGDGGYGAILLCISFVAMIPSILKKKSPEPFVFLLSLLGFATMAWGAITCTWFGLSPEQLPDFVKKLSIPCLSNSVGNAKDIMGNSSPISFLTNEAWVKENLQIFCFALALIQLTVAHFKGIIKNIKSLRAFGELGSMLQLWGMFYVVLSMVVDGRRFPLGETEETYYLFNTIPVPLLCIGLIGVGFVLSFVFSNYENSIGKSILESCKNIVSVLLGVVNIFSDIVSYIRLWAVALAGGAISATVNEMAGPMLGHAIMFIFALLILFVGHGLNMILNVLSVIVHGVRLNTLEFSSHLGMSWTGFKYNPFKE